MVDSCYCMSWISLTFVGVTLAEQHAGCHFILLSHIPVWVSITKSLQRWYSLQSSSSSWVHHPQERNAFMLVLPFWLTWSNSWNLQEQIDQDKTTSNPLVNTVAVDIMQVKQYKVGSVNSAKSRAPQAFLLEPLHHCFVFFCKIISSSHAGLSIRGQHPALHLRHH